jgi:hypothetical protein
VLLVAPEDVNSPADVWTTSSDDAKHTVKHIIIVNPFVFKDRTEERRAIQTIVGCGRERETNVWLYVTKNTAEDPMPSSQDSGTEGV